MAFRAACLSASGAGKSGKPWARLMAPWRIARRVISRMTDSVNRRIRRLRKRERTELAGVATFREYEKPGWDVKRGGAGGDGRPTGRCFGVRSGTAHLSHREAALSLVMVHVHPTPPWKNSREYHLQAMPDASLLNGAGTDKLLPVGSTSYGI